MPYLNEVLWITSCLGIITFLMLRYTPRHRFREAWVVFLFCQMILWGFGTVIFYRNMISSPVRPFPHALKAYFFDAYLFYPAIAVSYYFLCERFKNRIPVPIMTITFAILYTFWDYTETQLTKFKQYDSWVTSIVVFLVSIVALHSTWWFTKLFFYYSKERDPNSET